MKGNQTNEVFTNKNIESNNSEVESNKQIEEMTIYLYRNTTAYNTCWEEDCEDIAKILYKAGYRKVDSVTFMGGIVEQMRAEVAREIFEKIETFLNLNKWYGDSGIYFESDIETDIAELKKKYIGE